MRLGPINRAMDGPTIDVFWDNLAQSYYIVNWSAPTNWDGEPVAKRRTTHVFAHLLATYLVNATILLHRTEDDPDPLPVSLACLNAKMIQRVCRDEHARKVWDAHMKANPMDPAFYKTYGIVNGAEIAESDEHQEYLERSLVAKR